VNEADPFLVAWGLFRALEAAEMLPDPTVGELLEAAEAEIGVQGLYSGLALVATVLRYRSQEHAQELGCDCGSVAWLEREHLNHAEHQEDE
jgi:hypothetical protein